MVDTDLPIITSNYRALLADEVPILFTGTNRFGTFIIGSSVDENYKQGVERYFHILVDKTDYFSFLKRQITYLQLLKQAKPIFVVDKLVNENTHNISQITFDEIPVEYRPFEGTLCPVTAHEPSYSYSTSLVGGLADTNHAFPEDVSQTQNSIAEAITSALNSLQRWLGIEPEVLLQPSTGGSFKINYEVRLKGFPNLFVNEVEYFQYLNQFLEYCFDRLPVDSDKLANLSVEGLDSFNSLIHQIYVLGGRGVVMKLPEDALRESVIEDLTTTSQALQVVAGTVGKNYKSIVVANVSAESEHPLGIINEAYQKQISKTVSLLTASLAQIEAQDEETKEYIIHIFEFNKNTGTGFAYMRDLEDESKQNTVRIAVIGYEPMSPSRYTTSLDQNQFIKVRGILRKSRRLDKLEIIEETTE